MNTLAFITILDGLLMLAARVPAVMTRLQVIRDEIAGMKAEGRDPTPEEWEAVGQRVDDKLARLKAKA